MDPARVAALLLEPGQAAECARGRAPSLDGRHAGGDVFCDELVEVKAQFGVELEVRLLFSEQRTETQDYLIQ
jgi:hypothetical protein